MKKRLLWAASAVAVLAGIAVAGVYGYQYQQRRATLAALSPIVKQISVRLSESFAITATPNVTYKELFDRTERYVAAADDRMLELRAMDGTRASDEFTFATLYVAAAQSVWRTQNALYQANLKATAAAKFADDRLTNVRTTDRSSYGVFYAYKAIEDGKSSAVSHREAQAAHWRALNTLAELVAHRPAALSDSVVAADECAAATKRADEYTEAKLLMYRMERFSKELDGYRHR